MDYKYEDEDGEEFEYEASDSEVASCVEKFLTRDFKQEVSKKMVIDESTEKAIKIIAESLANDFDMLDIFEEGYHDEIEEDLEGKAQDENEDCKARMSDPLGYVGMSQSDFI